MDREIALNAARARVRNGIRFLVENAPSDWEMRLISFQKDGQAYLIAKDAYSEECALSRAFSTCPELAGPHGIVTFGAVVKMYLDGLGTAIGFGFHANDAVSSEILDQAWKIELFAHLAKRSTSEMPRFTTEQIEAARSAQYERWNMRNLTEIAGLGII